METRVIGRGVQGGQSLVCGCMVALVPVLLLLLCDVLICFCFFVCVCVFLLGLVGHRQYGGECVCVFFLLFSFFFVLFFFLFFL